MQWIILGEEDEFCLLYFAKLAVNKLLLTADMAHLENGSAAHQVGQMLVEMYHPFD